MIIIQIVDYLSRPVPRLLSRPLEAAAEVMPVVIVTGARQTGKSTLVRDLGDGDRFYLTLDDIDVLEQATREPESLVSRARRMTLDEVQRAPELMLAVKRAVDSRREKGRYLLTGSANLLLLRSVSETLAGRAAYLTLWPMTRREQLGLGTAGIWDSLLAAEDEQWPEIIASQQVGDESWSALALRGGYPTPALELETAAERATWFTGYTKTYLERDLQDISSVSALPDLRRLMRAASLRLGQLVNQTELGRDVALPQPTVHRYLNLLEMSYQLVRGSGVLGQPHPAAHQDTETLLVRHRTSVAPRRAGHTVGCPPRESRSHGSLVMARRTRRSDRGPLLAHGDG